MPGFGEAVLDETSYSYGAIRGREQLLIQGNGGAQSMGGTSPNVRNGISPRSNSVTDWINEAITNWGSVS